MCHEEVLDGRTGREWRRRHAADSNPDGKAADEQHKRNRSQHN
jgi:hypothetical protein